jgi:hypothetical protein
MLHNGKLDHLVQGCESESVGPAPPESSVKFYFDLTPDFSPDHPNVLHFGHTADFSVDSGGGTL